MGHQVISSILRHDAKQNSYKFALLRALNDIVLSYPDLRHSSQPIAIPLARIAEAWVAYYWSFVDPSSEVMQGPRASHGETKKNDFSFRPFLRDLRKRWESAHGSSSDGEGWILIEQMRNQRTRASMESAFVRAYDSTIRKITDGIKQPLQYAGDGQWSIFSKPQKLALLSNVAPLPGSRPNDACTLVDPSLWNAFRDVSLWVEALAVHEWALFTSRVAEMSRGDAYQLLTQRPDRKRLPITWERNQVLIRMEEGVVFQCPWTKKRIQAADFHLDHIIPIAIHPFHDLWNLVPSDPKFNMHGKRDKLPSSATLQNAAPVLVQSYSAYLDSPSLSAALVQDARKRFLLGRREAQPTAEEIFHHLSDLTESVASLRNIGRF